MKISLGKFTNMLILVTWEEGPWVASAEGGRLFTVYYLIPFGF